MANRQKEIAKAVENAKKQALKAQKELQELSAESYVYNNPKFLALSEECERKISDFIEECDKVM